MKKKLKLVWILIIVPLFLALIIHFPTNKIENQYNWSTENQQQFNKKIIKDKSIAQEFVAANNNLGTIAVQFTNFQKINDDFVIFKITQKNETTPIYENTYKVDQFHPNYPFTFGFPPINDSKNKTYIFEIKSTKGTISDSVGLSGQKYFSARYDFSFHALKNDPKKIIELLQINFVSIIQTKGKTLFFTLLIYYIIAITIFLSEKMPKLSEKILNFISKFFPIILFALTTIVSGYFSTIGTDAHHDGILFKPALDVSQGLMLFKDTFTQYGALTTLIQSLSIKLFGEYLIVIKLITAVFYGFISVTIYYIWSKFLNKYAAFFATLIWLFLAPYYILTFLPWSSVYALFFQCLTIIFIQKYSEHNKLRNIVYAGAMSALAFWCKQNVGLYTILGSLTSILIIGIIQKQKKKKLIKNIFSYAAGGIAISLPLIIWIVTNGALIDWWKQTILYSIYWAKTNKPIEILKSLFPYAIGPISIWAISPIITAYIIFKQLIIDKKKNLLLLIVAIFGIFSWAQYYPITCIRHVYWAATPMIGIVIYFFYEQISDTNLIKKHRFLKVAMLLLVCALVLGPDINSRIQSGKQKIATRYTTLNEPKVLKNMKLLPEEADFYSYTYQQINKYIEKKGDTNLITTSPNPLYLTFGKSINFHPMYANWASINESIYQDYPIALDVYISSNKPIIISMWERMAPGYCRIDGRVNSIDSAFLIVPCK